MADYIPNTPRQQQAMLETIGLRDIEDLFSDVPAGLRLQRKLDLPPPMAEMELIAHMERLADQNSSPEDLCCFLGAGAYDHYIPAAVKALVSRQEFYTAYTPYQPEISQGTLQAIFEYQTMVCELTGMDVSNASMYDGASALAEAAGMACAETKKKRLLVAASIHPHSRAALDTYARFREQTVESFAFDAATGEADLDDLAAKLTDDTAAVIVQNPNFFGVVEDLKAIAGLAAGRKALFVTAVNPVSLGLLLPPGEAGADIVVAEGQSLGNSLNFGGPYLGILAARQALTRKLPGRIAGETVDAQGRRCYCLTIQSREQHIRREKANSNICTNQALNALCAAIYLATAGRQGLSEIAGQCAQKAHYLYRRLLELPQFRPMFSGPFFNEFTVKYDGDPATLNRSLAKASFIGGFPAGTVFPGLDGAWILAVTEKRTKDDMDRLMGAISDILRGDAT